MIRERDTCSVPEVLIPNKWFVYPNPSPKKTANVFFIIFVSFSSIANQHTSKAIKIFMKNLYNQENAKNVKLISITYA